MICKSKLMNEWGRVALTLCLLSSSWALSEEEVIRQTLDVYKRGGKPSELADDIKSAVGCECQKIFNVEVPEGKNGRLSNLKGCADDFASQCWYSKGNCTIPDTIVNDPNSRFRSYNGTRRESYLARNELLLAAEEALHKYQDSAGVDACLELTPKYKRFLKLTSRPFDCETHVAAYLDERGVGLPDFALKRYKERWQYWTWLKNTGQNNPRAFPCQSDGGSGGCGPDSPPTPTVVDPSARGKGQKIELGGRTIVKPTMGRKLPKGGGVVGNMGPVLANNHLCPMAAMDLVSSCNGGGTSSTGYNISADGSTVTVPQWWPWNSAGTDYTPYYMQDGAKVYCQMGSDGRYHPLENP